ncbi:MAG TPA: hypothetical protein VLS93_17965 [Anaeromyxobacteraceae bacterium]|nr:hypothetical protein [Anaeromyxobacteraceae bacterium]
MLGDYRDEHLGALAVTVVQLADLRLKLALTARQKNAQTIIDKLRLAPKMELSNMQDIAGARVIVAGGRRAQDEAVKEIVGRFQRHKDLRDRRSKPSYGYRAVHVIVKASECWAEVQVRTPYQDRWAQTFERLGDDWGRQIRYGEPPDEPETTTLVAGAPVARAEVVAYMRELSDMIDDVETEEVRVFEAMDESASVQGSLSATEREERLAGLSAAQRDCRQRFHDIDAMFEALRDVVPVTPASSMVIGQVAPAAGTEVPHFLVAYRRSTDALLEVRSFTSAHVDDAVALRARFEQEHRGDPDFEAVLLASRSEAELRQTHARYFKNLGQLVRPGGDDSGQGGQS